MTERADHIIVLDDETSMRQRVVGILAFILIIASLAFPIGRGIDVERRGTEAPTLSSQQTVLNVCGSWDVPEVFQPLANAAYPSWSWVCRLVEG